MALADTLPVSANTDQRAPDSSNNNPAKSTLLELNLDPSRLSSNNPFRNRLSVQPSSSSPRAMDSSLQQFPFPATTTTTTTSSTNPFLDPGEPTKKSMEKTPKNNTAEVEEIFKDVSISDKPAFSNGPIPPKAAPVRNGTLPPHPRPLGPDERRDRPPRDPRDPRGPMRGPHSPEKRPEHRRRASETSTMEIEKRDRRERQMERGERDRPPRTESEERRRRERRREREERHRREKERVAAGGKPRRPFRNLDLIDKLDVTGVYGEGLFHHDGPFDACRPTRNAKKDRRAPIQAFPEGSANMAIGGSGPNRSRLDLDKFHGRTEEGFTDYNITRKADTAYQQEQKARGEPLQYFNSTDRTEQVHGEESYGLGTSTFLEGAPASRKALQRRESEEQAAGADAGNMGGLSRKKSLAQRFRGMSAPRPRSGAPEGLRSPDARYKPGTPIELSENTPPQLLTENDSKAQAATYAKENEINPYDEAFEKKGTEIKWAEQEKSNVGRPRAPSSPGANGLSRAVTADAAIASPTEEKPSGGGFLNRMKSLKGGGRKSRPERKDSGS